MQVSVGCGTVCAFHVGGTAETESSLGRWEFFIGDHPHKSAGPVEQISLIEGSLEAGEVGLSAEVIAQVGFAGFTISMFYLPQLSIEND
jgi:hypothetical protein